MIRAGLRLRPLLIGLGIVVLGVIGCAAWWSALVSDWNEGRMPFMDLLCPPCGAIHGVLNWLGWDEW
jgi:hypothetical protein